jgi:hypothetical protein
VLAVLKKFLCVQVFGAWEEVTAFFGETGKQEGWFPAGSDMPAGGRNGDSGRTGSEIVVGGFSADLDDDRTDDLGLGEQGRGGDWLVTRDAKRTLDERPLNGVNQPSESGAEYRSVSSKQMDAEAAEAIARTSRVPRQSPALSPKVDETVTGQVEELVALDLAAQPSEEQALQSEQAVQSKAPFQAITSQGPLPVTAAKRSPLPPPIVPAVLDAAPPVSALQTAAQGFNQSAIGEWATPARQGPPRETSASEPPVDAPTPESHSKGGFVYERKDGVKVRDRLGKMERMAGRQLCCPDCFRVLQLPFKLSACRGDRLAVGTLM